MRGALVAILGICLLGSLVSGAAGADSPNPLIRLPKAIQNVIRYQIGAQSAFKLFQDPRHDDDKTLIDGEQDLKDGNAWIVGAEKDATAYESDATALPAADRPAGAISGARDIRELLAKSARYDDAALKLAATLDEAYANWNGTGSATQKEQVQRLAKQIYDDLETAWRVAVQARDKALPVLPSKVSSISGIVRSDANITDCGAGPGETVNCYEADISFKHAASFTLTLPKGAALGSKGCGVTGWQVASPTGASFECQWSGSTGPAKVKLYFETTPALTDKVTINAGPCPEWCADLSGP